MSQYQIRLPRLHCRRCAHRWNPRGNTISACPACGSAWWDRPRIRRITAALPAARLRATSGRGMPSCPNK